MKTNQRPATRQELLDLKKQIKRAQKGRALLKDKRDSLIKLFLEVIEEAIELRHSIKKDLQKTLNLFILAKSRIDADYLAAVTQKTETRVFLNTDLINQMGVQLPIVKAVIKDWQPSYSQRLTNQDLDQSLTQFESLIPLISQLLEKEHRALLLAEEIEKTRRRVNALDYVVIPGLQSEAKDIYQKLEEHSRATTVALMRFKNTIDQSFSVSQ